VQPFREALKAGARRWLTRITLAYQVRAPVDGVVALLAHPIGVVAATQVVRVAVATVPEERAGALTPGLALTVRASRGLLSKKLVGRVVEVGPSVEQLPVRSWLSPQWPRWGRRAVIQVEGEVSWQGGERLYVQF
jgi:hypothetical protein